MIQLILLGLFNKNLINFTNGYIIVRVHGTMKVIVFGGVGMPRSTNYQQKLAHAYYGVRPTSHDARRNAY